MILMKIAQVRMKKPPAHQHQWSYQKMTAAEEFQRLNFRVIAVGFSFNDIGMLKQSECGVLFNPSSNVPAGPGQWSWSPLSSCPRAKR